MPWEAGVTLAVVAGALVLLLLERLTPDLVLMSALGLLAIIGIVELERAMVGFADPTLLALGSLFVVAEGLRSTGVLRRAAQLLFGAGRTLRSVLLRLSSAGVVSSAFLNNTPIVAMGIPAVLGWSRGKSVRASRLLIPLSYASILGGTCTLIGTSTNLVADGLLRAHGMEGLGFFELGAVGLPLAVVGVAYLVLLTPRLLPARDDLSTDPAAEGHLAPDIHLFRVSDESAAVSRTVQDVALNRPELQLARLVRASGMVVQVAPDTLIQTGDRLTFRGALPAMEETAGRLDLEPLQIPGHESLSGRAELREAVIPENSTLAGSRLGALDFDERYGALVVGVVRRGRQLDALEDVVLRPGDTLFLVGREGFSRGHAAARGFQLLEQEDRDEAAASGQATLLRPTRAKAGLAVLAGIVVTASTGLLHISLAALAGAVAMVVTGLISPAEARRAVDWSVLIVVGAAIGLGEALQSSGAASILAEGIVGMGAPFGPRGVLTALLAGTMVFTALITNNAAVAMIFPVAASAAAAQGLDPRPLVIAVTLAGSLAFATPFGYQTNLMVYGPGGYRFTDFVRVGLPLQLALAVLTVVLVPWVWPL